ncbi:MAG: glutamate racemase [Bacilli bacterium]|nr:glutamate racemase [Bacilli bacterium]
MRIGVFDSGIGGLNVLKELLHRHPNLEYLYYGDTFYLPYGEKSREELIKLGVRIIRFFEEAHVDRIVIACGTCSSLIEEYKKYTEVPIDDVICPTVEYTKKHYHKVALLATSATIENGTFEKKLKQAKIEVEPLSCPNFVPYLEGLSEHLNMDEELKSIYHKDCEAVILGCTHYPLLKNEIEKSLSLPTIDMGKVLSEAIKLEDSKPMLHIYMSKVTPFLQRNVNKILERDILVIEKNLPV